MHNRVPEQEDRNTTNGSDESLDSDSLLDSALAYAAMGISIFPCRVNKAPYTNRGCKDATRNKAKIRTWWERWPTAMIGMPTGTASGIDVLDIDNKPAANGFASLPAGWDWQEKSSIIVRTISGGAHLYYASTGTVRNSKGAADTGIAPGLDTRGEGGYVILPPSRNGHGAYRFVRGNLESRGTLPSWPTDLPPIRTASNRRRSAPPPPQPESPPSPGSSAATSSPAASAELDEVCADMAATAEGARNDTLNKFSFAMGQLIAVG